MKFKFKFSFNRNISLVTGYFITIIFTTIISWILQHEKIINLNNSTELITRSIPHTIYILFEFFVFIFISIYLQNKQVHNNDIKVFITYSFYFISIWGIYQWATTFDIIPYWEIFNNSSSTGFTYLRFKEAHRTASVFPEPSEYGYYLSFLFPFIIHLWYKPEECICYSKHRKRIIILWIISVVLCRSMSMFITLPFIYFFIIKKYCKFTAKKLIAIIIIIAIGIFIIYTIEKDRLNNLFIGNDDSAIIRFNEFLKGYNMFIESPIIGGGFGAIRGLDLLSFCLSTTGIIGTLYLIYILIKIKENTKINKLFKDGMYCMVAISLISNPILDSLFFWVILAFMCNKIRER